MNYFCTYCDQGYASRLICLHDSLAASVTDLNLIVLCFDRKTQQAVEGLRRPTLIAAPIEDLLAADSEYAAVRTQRSPIEFYFTSTPVFLRYCFGRFAEADCITYLDADLYFFGAPASVFAVQGDASVGIVAHRFPARLASLSKNGTFNVAWVSFRRDANGMACLEWWRERCLEWCHDYVDQGRFGDQGYLDEFPRRFQNVRVLDHAGIDAAPWNIDGVTFERRAGQVFINDVPLLFFHFQGVRELLPGWYEPGLRNYGTLLTRDLRDCVYAPYLSKLFEVQSHLQEEFGIQPRRGHQRMPSSGTVWDRLKNAVIQQVSPYRRKFRGELIGPADFAKHRVLKS